MTIDLFEPKRAFRFGVKMPEISPFCISSVIFPRLDIRDGCALLGLDETIDIYLNSFPQIEQKIVNLVTNHQKCIIVIEYYDKLGAVLDKIRLEDCVFRGNLQAFKLDYADNGILKQRIQISYARILF